MRSDDVRSVLTGHLMRSIFEDYALPLFGYHGLAHWGRVLENGLELAPKTGADAEVVALFAVLHDARRRNEDTDPGHGARGAELAARLNGTAFSLDERRFELLRVACADHTGGGTVGDPTVQTCWDADRLDLSRVGVTPDPARLCTEAARSRHMIGIATARALQAYMAPIVSEEWIPIARSAGLELRGLRWPPTED